MRYTVDDINAVSENLQQPRRGDISIESVVLKFLSPVGAASVRHVGVLTGGEVFNPISFVSLTP